MNGILFKNIKIVKRYDRADVNSMVNVQGVKLGFEAKFKSSEFQSLISEDNNQFKITTFIQYSTSIGVFVLNKKYRFAFDKNT